MVELPGKAPRHMHGTQRMLRADVLRSWTDPAGALQLIYIAQTLHPERINQALLRDVTGPRRAFHMDSKRYVLMHRISKERQSLIVLFRHWCNHVWHGLSPA